MHFGVTYLEGSNVFALLLAPEDDLHEIELLEVHVAEAAKLEEAVVVAVAGGKPAAAAAVVVLLALVITVEVVEAAVAGLLEEVISGFKIHQLDFPAPSFCTLTNRL